MTAVEDWQKDQLRRSDLPPKLRSAVLQLLANWNNSYLKLSSAAEVKQALDAFYRLASNQALTRTDDPVDWQPARPGNIYVGDTVRVAHDAYESDAGRTHNGRVGRIVAIRHGDIVVKYTDDRPGTFDAVHHKPDRLERAQ